MRLFVGIELSGELREAAGRVIAELRLVAPDSKWVRAENLHLTLAFLGQVDEAQVEPIGLALRQVAGRHRALRLSVGSGGAFGSARRPRVLWLGMGGELEALATLRAEVEAAMVPFGNQPEAREFRPHLTVARARHPRGDEPLAACVERLREAELGELTVERVVLFQSQPGPGGSRYTVLREAALGPG
jgi:RNA 2',3'-cyclic 3'-phosphodiesterase